MAELTTFEKIMFKKDMIALEQARKKGNLDEVDRLVKKIAPIVDEMDEQIRAEFETQLNSFNMVADKVDEGANIINDGFDRVANSNNPDNFEQDVQIEMLNARLEALNDSTPGSKKAPLPSQQKQSLKERREQFDKKLNDRIQDAIDSADLLEETQNKINNIRGRNKPATVQAQTQPTAQEKTQAQAGPPTPAKKEPLAGDYFDDLRKHYSKKRKASMVDAKNDIKNASKAISKVLNKIIKAIKKAPEQEKTLSADDKQVIEQSADRIVKSDLTPTQAMIYAATILDQIKNSSKRTAGATQETVAPKQGWLTRALDKVSAALTTISNTLGFKSAKEELQETLKNIDVSATHDTTNEQEKPNISKDNDIDNEQEQEPESPGSRFQ